MRHQRLIVGSASAYMLICALAVLYFTKDLEPLFKNGWHLLPTVVGVLLWIIGWGTAIVITISRRDLPAIFMAWSVALALILISFLSPSANAYYEPIKFFQFLVAFLMIGPVTSATYFLLILPDMKPKPS